MVTQELSWPLEWEIKRRIDGQVHWCFNTEEGIPWNKPISSTISTMWVLVAFSYEKNKRAI